MNTLAALPALPSPPAGLSLWASLRWQELRRRQRMLERQKPVEVPKPMYTGEELEKHLQNYQMEVIRQGLPPLPVQLTPDRDAQLVAEGFLPPVDEEGYELNPDGEGEEEYYEEEAY